MGKRVAQRGLQRTAEGPFQYLGENRSAHAYKETIQGWVEEPSKKSEVNQIYEVHTDLGIFLVPINQNWKIS